MTAHGTAFILTTLLTTFGLPCYAAANSTLYVHVSNRAGSVKGAVCRLENPFSRSRQSSDGEGVAIFGALQAGTYVIQCERDGVDSQPDRIVVHADDAELHIEVTLGPLRQIAHVVAHSQTNSTARTVRRNSPLGTLSENLYDAINRIGGANVLVDASGSLSGISLEGRDPRLTQYGFDGSRIPEPGALRAFDADLLQSAQIDDDKLEANFYTLAPTTFPEYTVRQTFGGFGAGATQIGARGSVGSIGYVLQGSLRSQQSALDNAVYLDTSGLKYKHVGTYDGGSMIAKIAGPIGADFTATLETLLRRSTTSPIDTFYAGPLPSGAGPGNLIQSSSALTRLELDGDIAGWDAKFGIATIHTKQHDDFRDRIAGLQPLPSIDDQRLDIDLGDFTFIKEIRGGQTLNINASVSRGRALLSRDDLSFGRAYASRQESFRPDDDLQITYALHPSERLLGTLQLDTESRGNAHTATYFEGHASVGPPKRRLFATLGFGGRAIAASDPQAFDDPAAAQYDCSGGAIRVRAPNDDVTNVREHNLRLGMSSESSGGSVSAQIYDTLDAGTTISNADTPLGSYPASLLPAGFADDLLQGYTSIGGCPAPSAAPAIYLLRDVTGSAVEYRGFEVTGSVKPTKLLTVQGAFNVHQAILRGGGAALTAPDSPYVIGKQLPSVEPLDASFTLDYGFHDGHSELIANAVYKPRNNGNELPAYWLVTLGAARKLSPACSLTLVATNVSHGYVSLFSSPSYAVPLATVSGRRLLLPASPLVQPQVYLTLDVQSSRGP